MKSAKLLIIFCVLLFSKALKSQESAITALQQELLKGDYYACIALANKTLSSNPKNNEIYYYKALSLRKTQNLQKANIAISEAISLQNNNPKYISEQGKIHMLSGNTEKAINSFKKVFFNLDTLDYSTGLLLGKCYLKEEQWNNGHELFNKLLQKDSLNTYYLYKQAICLTMMKEGIRAIPYLNKIITIDSCNLKAPMLLHKIYIATNERDKAIAQLDKLKVIEPANYEYYKMAGEFHMVKSHAFLANNEFEKAIELGDPDFETQWKNGRCLYQMKFYEEAIPYLSANEDGNMNFQDFQLLANCYQQLNNTEKAIHYYKKTLNIAIPSAMQLMDTYRDLANIEIEKGQYNAALIIYNDFIALCKYINAGFSAQSFIYRDMAAMYETKMNQPEKALELYKNQLSEMSEYNNLHLVHFYKQEINRLSEEVFFKAE